MYARVPDLYWMVGQDGRGVDGRPAELRLVEVGRVRADRRLGEQAVGEAAVTGVDRRRQRVTGVDLRDGGPLSVTVVDVRQPGRGVVHEVRDRRRVLRIASPGDPEDRVAEGFRVAARSSIPGVAGNMFPVNAPLVMPTNCAFVVGLKSQLL